MAVEMWFLRKMHRIPLTDRTTNEQVLQETNEDRKLIRDIRRRQTKFFGHVMRRNELDDSKNAEVICWLGNFEFDFSLQFFFSF